MLGYTPSLPIPYKQIEYTDAIQEFDAEAEAKVFNESEIPHLRMVISNMQLWRSIHSKHDDASSHRTYTRQLVANLATLRVMLMVGTFEKSKRTMLEEYSRALQKELDKADEWIK